MLLFKTLEAPIGEPDRQLVISRQTSNFIRAPLFRAFNSSENSCIIKYAVAPVHARDPVQDPLIVAHARRGDIG